MVLSKFYFYSGKKRVSLVVKECKSLWSKFSGLMFRKKGPALIFIFNREKMLTIHSFFCKPFVAIWLDNQKRITKIEKVPSWKCSVSGFGRYLLEVSNYDENYLKMTKAAKFSDGQKRKV